MADENSTGLIQDIESQVIDAGMLTHYAMSMDFLDSNIDGLPVQAILKQAYEHMSKALELIEKHNDEIAEGEAA